MINLLAHGHEHTFEEPLGLLTDCHRRIERFLELLRRVAGEFSHKPLDAQATEALRTAQRYFAHAAPKHTADEEDSLFPRVRAAATARGTDCAALARLHRDHEHADRLHAQVDVLLHAWLRDASLPPDRSSELSTLLDALRELYREHIRTEEAEVFPLAGSLLSSAELSAVGEEMRARRGLKRPE